MSGQAYLCSNCSHRFTLEADAERRCPNCLRATGIAPDQGAKAVGAAAGKAERSGGPMKAVALVLVLISTGFAAWYFTRTPPSSATDPAAATDAKDSKATGADVASVPAPFNVRLDAPTDALKAAAAKWPTAIAELSAEARKKVTARTKDMDFEPSAPNDAVALAEGAEGARAGSFEMAQLVGGLLKAGGKSAEYGFATDEPQAMTAVMSRRYLVREAGGDWFDPSVGKAFKGDVTPLNQAQVLANTLALRAMVFIDHQKGDEASQAMGHARRLAPNDPAIRFAYGEVQVFNELTDMGISTMEDVAKTHADAMTWTTLGEYASQNRLLFKAQQYFQKAAEADPKFVKPHALMAQLALERLNVTPKDQHPALITQIETHVKKAESIDPKAEGIRTIRAQMALVNGKLEEAEPLIQEEVKLHPQSRNAALTLAQFYAQQQKLPEAIQALQDALKRGISSYELRLMLGSMLAFQRDVEGALAQFNAALKMAPFDSRIRPQLAQNYAAKGDADQAMAVLTEQITRFPQDTNSKLLLAQLGVQTKQWAKAEAQLADVAKDTEAAADPRVAVLRYLVALGTKKGVPEYQEAAVKAVKLHSNLAQLLLEQGMIPQAEAVLLEAVDKAPTDEQAPYMLVAIMAAQGRAKEAQAVVDKVVARTAKDDVDKVKEQFKMTLEQAQKAQQAMPELPPVPDVNPNP